MSKKTGHSRRIAPSVPLRGCLPAGNFPEIVATGSFLPESFIRTCQYRACTFGAPPDSLFTHGVSSLLRLVFNCGLHCTSKQRISQVKLFYRPVNVLRTQSPTSQYLKSWFWLTWIAAMMP